MKFRNRSKERENLRVESEDLFQLLKKVENRLPLLGTRRVGCIGASPAVSVLSVLTFFGRLFWSGITRNCCPCSLEAARLWSALVTSVSLVHARPPQWQVPLFIKSLGIQLASQSRSLLLPPVSIFYLWRGHGRHECLLFQGFFSWQA